MIETFTTEDKIALIKKGYVIKPNSASKICADGYKVIITKIPYGYTRQAYLTKSHEPVKFISLDSATRGW